MVEHVILLEPKIATTLFGGDRVRSAGIYWRMVDGQLEVTYCRLWRPTPPIAATRPHHFLSSPCPSGQITLRHTSTPERFFYPLFLEPLLFLMAGDVCRNVPTDAYTCRPIQFFPAILR